MMAELSSGGGPIFILGMLQRSGTNFLRDLLVEHPHCQGSDRLAEDHLVHHAELLAQYSGWVSGHWANHTAPEDVGRLQAELLQSIGRGLREFIAESVGGYRPVLKTPSVRNVDLFFRLFEDASLLILVRDGRSMVESGMRSFGWDFEEAARNWATAADRITGFRTAMGDQTQRWRIVRYEDLLTDSTELRDILAAVSLDADSYDFEAARRMPVKGSSSYRRAGGDVHWQPVEPGADFQPLNRWADWSQSRHARFNWLAGAQMRALGYELVEPGAGGARRMWNRYRDGRWFVRRVRDRLLSRVRR
jgi:hypothetical protein